MEDLAPLALRYQDGDEAALAELVRAAGPMVGGIARTFRRSGEPAEDLRQTGYVGLIKAAKAFDARFGVLFQSFARHYVAGEIGHALRDRGAIRTPRTNAGVPHLPYLVESLEQRFHGRWKTDGDDETVGGVTGAEDPGYLGVEYRLDLLRLVARLPVRQRVGVLAYCLLDFSQAEAARIARTSQKHLSRRWKRMVREARAAGLTAAS